MFVQNLKLYLRKEVDKKIFYTCFTFILTHEIIINFEKFMSVTLNHFEFNYFYVIDPIQN